MKSNQYQSIVRDPNILNSVTEAYLSHQQKNKAKAIAIASSCKDRMVRSFELCLSRILNDNEVVVDVKLCSGTIMEEWYTDQTKLRVTCEIEGAESASAHVAVDYSSVFQLATISFGGSNVKGEDEERKGLTPAEKRVGLRFAMAQISALQKTLKPSSVCMPVEEVNSFEGHTHYEHMIFKIRASLSGVVVSWYIWLPVTLFISSDNMAEHSDTTPLMNAGDWRKLPVKCDIELARRKSDVKELKQFLAGDLIPIELREPALLSLGDHVFFEGNVLENEHSLNFKVERNCAKNE